MAANKKTLQSAPINISKATSPREFSCSDIKQIAGRLIGSIGKENMTLIAAGVGFYAMLALVPTIVALVSIYGFIADPADMRHHVELLEPVVPENAYALIHEQVNALAQKSTSTFGVASVAGALLAIWSAKAGVNALSTGLNIANREREGRSFLKGMLVSYALTFCIILVMAITLAAIIGVPAALSFVPDAGWRAWLALWLRWPIAVGAVVILIGLLYRLGPSRRGARLPWLSSGAVLATFVWLLASVGFSYYVSHLSDYHATYGSLGAVVVLMLWFWLSALIVLLGARLNAEMEFQTEADTTVGPPRPKGRRGAYVADNAPSEETEEAQRSRADPLGDGA